MKESSKDIYKEIDDFFSSSPSVNQKAWGMINEFYHLILTHMEKNNITRADLSRKLGKSRSAISQLFNKTPNITVRKMVEIAEAINLDIHILSEKTLYKPIFIKISNLENNIIELPISEKKHRAFYSDYQKSSIFNSQLKIIRKL